MNNRKKENLVLHIILNFNKYIIVIIILLNLVSCSRKNHINKQNYNFKSSNGLPDYSNLQYWAAHPWKWDPSDSIPTHYGKEIKNDSSVDVFYIHPTTLVDKKDERWNANIDDSLLNIKTDYSAILYQASVFNKNCRIFAPRYRQAHLKTFYTDNKFQAGVSFEKAYSDIKNAFEYYLSHYNGNRPIVIASHSQGTIHAGRLLKDYFEGKNLQNKLICAYVIGMPVPENYFKKITPCIDSTATGCFVSWRTFKKGYNDTNYVSKEKFKSIVINPLTWTMDTLYASAKQNLGGVLKNFNNIKHNVVDAQIHGNVLWASKPQFFGSIFLTQKNYHVGDINLFYENIRENVQTRIKMYFLNHKPN
jgi:hypothetical protein